MLNCKLKTVSHSRVVSTYNLTNTECSTYNLTNKYITYVCFTVKHRTNSLVYYQNNKYSEEQEQTHNLIKSVHDKIKEFHDGGLGYRRIAYWLNENQYKTPRGHELKNNHVHSILKKRRIRNERIYKIYEITFGEWYVRDI